MKIKLIILMLSLISTANAIETNNYKNIKYGFELSYPKDWSVINDGEYNLVTQEEIMGIPLNEGSILRFNYAKTDEKKCAFEGDCRILMRFGGGGNKKSYLESRNYENTAWLHTPFNKYMPEITRRTKSDVLNGQPIEIFIRKLGAQEYHVAVYIYCKDIYFYAELGTAIKSSKAPNIVTDLSKPVTLEALLNPEQLLIVNSFKCPDPSFFKNAKKRKNKFVNKNY